MTTVYVNGEKCTLHESVGWLNYDRVVRLSGLPSWKEYAVQYSDSGTYMHDLGGGVFPMEGTHFRVTPLQTKPWWRWLWPA